MSDDETDDTGAFYPPAEPLHLATLLPVGVDLFTGVTPGAGLPYPESADPANQGANNIKALALALDPNYYDAVMPQTPSQDIPSGAWTIVPCTNLTASFGPAIIPSSGVAGGVRFTKAGRYILEGHISFVSNGNGRRGVGFSASAAGPGTNRMTLGQGPASGTATITYSSVWQAAANTEAILMAYQDSGVVLAIQSRGLRATLL